MARIVSANMRKGDSVGKKEKLLTLAKLSSKHPKSILQAIRYFGQYGYIGLRERLYQEVLMEDESIPLEADLPGSIEGSLKISILMPVYDVDRRWLDLAIASVERQSYGNWELCIVDDCSTDGSLKSHLKSKQSEKIKVKWLDKNSGIAEATNAAAKMAKGDYFVLLDNDDELTWNALFELYACVSNTHADIVYSDHEVVDEKGNRLASLYKPDWSPDLLLSQMYFGHMLAFRRSLFEKIGGFNSSFDGSQDYDLLLRLTENTKSIEHINQCLYSWRALPTSTAANPDSKPYAQIAGLNAIQAYLDRQHGIGKAAVCETENLFVYDVRYLLTSHPLVSIIIPTKDHSDDLQAAVESIIEKTTYENYEIIILNNNSCELSTFRYFDHLVKTYKNIIVEEASYDFNWSKLNNHGASKASGDVFVFLNNDVVVSSEDWLDRLVENSIREDVGIVGGLLLYPDGTIQHAGVVIGMGGWADHVYKGAKPIHIGNPYISPMVTRNVSAITGACMAVSRQTFLDIGGFNESFIVCGSDVEFCIRAGKNGLRNLFIPQVRLIHHESKTRDVKNTPEIDFELSKMFYRKFFGCG